jgi:hypothetical protein
MVCNQASEEETSGRSKGDAYDIVICVGISSDLNYPVSFEFDDDICPILRTYFDTPWTHFTTANGFITLGIRGVAAFVQRHWH